MNHNIPVYPYQIGDGYTKYYTQSTLPYVQYNSGVPVGINPYQEENKFPAYHAQPYTRIPGSSALNPVSRPPPNVVTPTVGPRYPEASTIYPRFSVPTVTGQSLIQSVGLPPSSTANTYLPGTSKSSPVNPGMLLNSPDMSGDYPKPTATPPGSYRSTTSPLGTGPIKTPHLESLKPLANQTSFPSLCGSYAYQASRTPSPPQSAEDKFKAKASLYGIEISSTVEQFLKTQDKDQKMKMTTSVSKSDSGPNLTQNKPDLNIPSSLQKTLTNGTIFQNSEEIREIEENIDLVISDHCNAGKELLGDEKRDSTWDLKRNDSVLSYMSTNSENLENDSEEDSIKSGKDHASTENLEKEVEKDQQDLHSESSSVKEDQTESIDEIAKRLVNDAIVMAVSELEKEMEGKEIGESKKKLYSWQARYGSDKQTNGQSVSINKSAKLPSVVASKLLRTVLDPGSPEFTPKERTQSSLNPVSPEFNPAARVSQPLSMSLVNSVSSNTEPNSYSFNPAQHIHKLSHGHYSKNASCQTWVDPVVDASCNTSRVKVKDQSVETATCDSREVGVNTTETFELEEDDTIIIPMNELRTKVLETQRELLLLRGKVCLDEMERQVTSLEKSKETLTTYFDLQEIDMEEQIDKQITALKGNILNLSEEIEAMQKKLDSGEILSEVPCFEVSFPVHNQPSRMMNKKKLKSLASAALYLNRLSTARKTTVVNTHRPGRILEEVKGQPEEEEEEITSPVKSLSESQILKKKSKGKSKQKKSKSGGKGHMQDKPLDVKVGGEGEKPEIDQVEPQEKLSSVEDAVTRVTEDQGHLSSNEQVAKYLQQEWEKSVPQGLEKYGDYATPTRTSFEHSEIKNSKQMHFENSELEPSSLDPTSVCTGKTSAISLPTNAKEDIIQQSSHALQMEIPVQTAQTVQDQANNSISQDGSSDLGKVSFTERKAVNGHDLNIPVQLEDQKNDQSNNIPQPLSESQSVQNLIAPEKTSLAENIQLSAGLELNSEAVNANVLHQNMLKQGVTVDPILFEAVKAQIAQVYPDFAKDPAMLNSISLQQTMVLQACMLSGGNVGATEMLPNVKSEFTTPEQEKRSSVESLPRDELKDTTSCVQSSKSLPLADKAVGISVPSTASGAIPKQPSAYKNSGITARQLPSRSGLPVGLTKSAMKNELEMSLELNPGVAPPPGLAAESISNSNILSKASNLPFENTNRNSCSVPNIQTSVETSVTKPYVDQHLSTVNPQMACPPPLSLKPFTSDTEVHMKPYPTNFTESSSSVVHAKQPLAKMEDTFHSVGDSGGQLQKHVNQNQEQNKSKGLEAKICNSNLTASLNHDKCTTHVDSFSTWRNSAVKPELKEESKIETLNLDEIEDDDEEEEKQFELKSKSSHDVYNQWQKPLVKKTEDLPPPVEVSQEQHVMQKLGSVGTAKRRPMEKGSLRDWMKKDKPVEVGKNADQLDQISCTSDIPTSVGAQKGSGRQTPSSEMTEEEKENWTEVTKKGKKKELNQLPPPQPLNPPLKNLPQKMSTTCPSEKANNFEKLVQRLSEIFAGLNRDEVISVITSVRKQRGGLSGLSVKDIVAHARVFATQIMKNKNKMVTQCYPDFSMPFQRTQPKSPPKDDEDICVICHDGLSSEEVKSLDCGHVFHAGCIKQWVYGREMTCPTCRRLVLFPEEFPKLGK
ncbi:uncharacterized protein LOC134235106 [Saccostrea cucullata]|uniref:uncharacterized protein LOC134235106 n=1 Tax=Saccostrea cuccullata TaxID=36930 RepID=UPI002ED281E9